MNGESVMRAPDGGSRTIWLIGLDCADCAAKIERAAGRIEGVTDARLDFVGRRLVIEAADKSRLPALARQAAAVAQDIEPDVRIAYSDPKTAALEQEPAWKKRLEWASLIVGAALFVAGAIVHFADLLPWWGQLIICLPAWMLIGGDVLLKAGRNILKGRVFDENFLMSIATIGAFASGEFVEGVAVMLFYQIGERLQHAAVNRSRRSIGALMDIRPDAANLITDGGVRVVAPEEVAVGDRILVRAGEKVPLDGVVVDGRASLDMAALNGESVPRDVGPGSEALSGAINRDGLLTMEVTKEFGESTVSKILEMTQNAASGKAPAERFITRFARVYTPVVVLAAVLLAVLPPLLLPGAAWSDWVHRALIFLVVSCPCALVVSIPLTFFAGIGSASKKGILIKGSQYLESLGKAETVVFDKTGTLTRGVFTVTAVEPSGGFAEKELLYFAAHAERHSGHPIARSVVAAFDGSWSDDIAGYEEIAGQGLRAVVDGRAVAAGNRRLVEAPEGAAAEPGTAVFVAVDGVYAGRIQVADTPRPDSAAAIRGLREAGVRRTVMLTGDNEAAGQAVARELGLDEAVCGLLPHQKVEQLERLEAAGGKGSLVFVGDGINDAPVLARADVGVAMGGLGSDAAIEAADIVLMTDEPSRLVDAVRISRRTRRIIIQNIVFSLAVKAVLLALGALGLANMWMAVFGDVGVTLIAVLNAMRAIRE